MSESVSKTQYLQTILELSGGDDDSKISNNQIADHERHAFFRFKHVGEVARSRRS